MHESARLVKRLASRIGARRAMLGATGFAAAAGIVAAAIEAWAVAAAIVLVVQFAIVVGLADLRRRTARQYDLQSALRTVQTTEERLQHFGSSVLASIERSRADITELIAEVRAEGGQDQRAVTPADLERASARVRAAVSDQVRQTEAMFQLVQRVNPRASMPASGGWAMDAENLLVLLDLLDDRRPELIVELGGGTSTIWLGYALQQAGRGRLISVEHDPVYADITRGEVARHGLADVVDVRLALLEDAPLDDHNTPWYAVSTFDDLTDIDLLVIDGPPQATGKLARFPAVPLLWDKLANNAAVALDDAHRDDERTSVELWTTTSPELKLAARSSKDHLVALSRVIANPSSKEG